jgi:methyl-accepting chemotaxis protein
MDQTTQQNAAMVEQSTAASHALAQEARQLVQLVSRFSIGERGGLAESRPAARPAAATTSHQPAANPVAAAQARVASFAAEHPPQTRGATALKSQPQADSWEEF